MHLIFDLDGTLIDSRAGIVESLTFATSKVLGININSDLLQIGPPIRDMIKEIFPETSSSKVDEIINIFRRHYDSKGWRGFSIYPNVKEVLETLKENNNLFIATNKPEKPTKKILEEMNVLNLFDKVLCYSNGMFENKSDMLLALKLNKNAEYRMIGDSTDDMLAASNNNIDFIHCAYGYGFIDPSDAVISCKIQYFSQLIKEQVDD